MHSPRVDYDRPGACPADPPPCCCNLLRAARSFQRRTSTPLTRSRNINRPSASTPRIMIGMESGFAAARDSRANPSPRTQATRTWLAFVPLGRRLGRAEVPPPRAYDKETKLSRYFGTAARTRRLCILLSLLAGLLVGAGCSTGSSGAGSIGTTPRFRNRSQFAPCFRIRTRLSEGARGLRAVRVAPCEDGSVRLWAGGLVERV